MVELRLLGPLEIEIDGRVLELSRAKLRALVGALAVDLNSSVTIDRIALWIWGPSSRVGTRNAIQTYVMRLRKQFGSAAHAVRTTPDGYLLQLDPSRVDIFKFEQLVDLAGGALARGLAAEAARSYAEALALWRGAPLADIESDWAQRDVASRLEERRLDVLEKRFEADLMVGRHAEIIAELQTEVSLHPFREQLWHNLILAQHRAGRSAEAVASFNRVSDLLSEHLNIRPGARLRNLYQKVLQGDEEGAASARGASEKVEISVPKPSQAHQVPAQLPADVSNFVGRRALLAAVDELRDRPPVILFSGAPGVGKTALAVRVAHRWRESFPDGQLFVNLRGYDAEAPLAALDVLPRFLRSLGLSAEQIPLIQEEQESLYQQMISGRSLCILLDNASSVNQVRPLLPRGSGCTVLVTSRHVLSELVEEREAQLVDVDVLEETEATELVIDIAGEHIALEEPEAVAEIVRLCGGLPLALRIAATNISGSSPEELLGYVDEFHRGSRLAVLSIADDDQAAVRAAFDISFSLLSNLDSRVFSLLAVVPGADFTLDVVAAVADLAVAEAESVLLRLVKANLVQWRSPGRFGLHDLLRAYAAERVRGVGAADVRAAEERLYDYYLTGAERAVRTLYPDFLPPNIPETNDIFEDSKQALSWLDLERGNLVSAACHAAVRGNISPGAQLAAMLFGYFYSSRRDEDWLNVCESVLQASVEVDDHYTMANMKRFLAGLRYCRSDWDSAIALVNDSIEIYRQLGAVYMQGVCLGDLGVYRLNSGDIEESFALLVESLSLKRSSGIRSGEANALLNLGTVSWTLADFESAVKHFEEALSLYRQVGSVGASAVCLGDIAYTYFELGDLDRSAATAAEALEGLESVGDSASISMTLENLAKIRRDQGDLARALEHARRALESAVDAGQRQNEASARIATGTILSALGRMSEAGSEFRASIAISREIEYWQGEVEALVGLAEMRRSSGDVEGAVETAQNAVALAIERSIRIRQGEAYLALARALSDAGDTIRAREAATEVLSIVKKSRQRLVEARASVVLDDLARRLGRE